jgi:hypothetical protein
MQLFTEGSDDLCIEDETEQWRRSLLLMGSISESQAYTNMVDSAHDLFVSGDSLETGTWITPSVAGSSADCTPERHKVRSKLVSWVPPTSLQLAIALSLSLSLSLSVQTMAVH